MQSGTLFWVGPGWSHPNSSWVRGGITWTEYLWLCHTRNRGQKKTFFRKLSRFENKRFKTIMVAFDWRPSERNRKIYLKVIKKPHNSWKRPKNHLDENYICKCIFGDTARHWYEYNIQILNNNRYTIMDGWLIKREKSYKSLLESHLDKLIILTMAFFYLQSTIM